MLRTLLTILLMLCTVPLVARGPLYVVNGTKVESIEHIEQANIAHIDVLPATEETIAEWGMDLGSDLPRGD